MASTGTRNGSARRTIWRPATLRPIFVRIVNEDLTESAQPIACPTLLLWGTDDTETPPWLGSRYKEIIGARATLELLPHKDHFPYHRHRRASVRVSIRDWLKDARPMSDFWPWLPLVAAAHTFLTWRRAARLSALLPAGRVRASALSPLGERPLADRSGVLAVDRLRISVPLVRRRLRLVCFVAGALLLGAGAARSPPLRQDPAEADVARHARADGRDGVRDERVDPRDQPVRRHRTSGAADCRRRSLFAVLPLVLIAANAALAPYEQAVQRRYEADAVARVAEVHPFIIGITGSYGKSSTKSMLAHILQFDGPTLAASGSINTLMGVTRHIREELVFGHRFMVVEMGAFKTGSIRRLCQLTPPSAGLITAVGDMHLERFGSTEEIVRAKSELAQALPPGGLLVVNADSPGALQIAKGATHRRVLLYGETSTEDLATRRRADRASRSRARRSCCEPASATYDCFTPLLGRPIILNLAGAFTLATALGVDPEIAVAALRTLKPVSNRLEVVEERGVTWIRDAYNSNQFGFRAALEVAAALPVARRFLATPGVIELGAQQFDVNRALSTRGVAICDNTLVVAETNREAFVAGPSRRRAAKRAWCRCTNRTEAFRWLRETLKDGRRRHSRERSAGSLRADGGRVLEGGRGIMSARRTVAVLFGGRSLEHDVSVVSGLQILHAIDPELVRADADLHRSGDALVDRRRPLAHRGLQGRRTRSIAV